MTISWQTIGPITNSGGASDRTADGPLFDAISESGHLREFLTSASTANATILLIVNDPHRPTRTAPALRAIGQLASQLGIECKFHALVATGTHRFGQSERQRFASDSFDNCDLNVDKVAWHDECDDGDLVEIAGVRMHPLIAQHRYLLPIGSVEPHYFAGVTGPHKTVTIGCMSNADIERNHAGALSPDSDILKLDGNPIHDGIVDVLRGLEAAGKTICGVGGIVCDDETVAAAVGGPVEILHTLLPIVRRTYVQTIAEPVDILRLRVPLPLGRNLYQADKAMKNNHRAVRDGGGIVVEADCPEGVGIDAFIRLLRAAGSYADAVDSVRANGYSLGDHKAVKLHHLMDASCRGVHVVVASRGLSADQLTGTGIEVFDQLEAALEALLRRMVGRMEHGLIIEDAGMVTVTAATESPDPSVCAG